MTPWMRKIHKWLGLLIGLQLVVWMASGLMMSLLDHDRVQGHAHRSHAHDEHAWPAGLSTPAQIIAASPTPVHGLSTGWLLGSPVYRLSEGKQVRLVDAASGKPVRIDAATASALASESYTGDGQPATPSLLAWTLEARAHEGPIWRVDFSDADDTTVYLSAQDGEVLEHRNKTWRLFDVFWMLHIMDYTGRKDFNNPLVVMAAIGGLWLALTGIWLLIASFRLSEFVPRRWRRLRELAVFDTEGTKLRTVQAANGDSVFLALGRNGLQLPSNCGGGQSCGLCEVRFRGAAPRATSADRAHLSESKLKLGYRLACGLRVAGDVQVEVAGGAGLWTEHVAMVESVQAVTPFLREIVLSVPSPPGPEFQPGCYLQIHVPGYSMQRHDISHPEDHRADWSALDLPATLSNKEPVRRSYSLSLPVEKAGGRLTLLARFSPGRPDRKRHPSGKGSTYLYGLKPGDSVRFSGPFGDFAVKTGGREKVFIGGGAGMAPLRAMVHACLDAGASERIHFWYGARNLREAPYVEEMAALANQYPNFSWHLVLSEAAECGAGLLQGLVHEAAHDTLLRDHPDLRACDFYLCGPPAMLAATRQLLQRLGVPEAQVAFDDFKI